MDDALQDLRDRLIVETAANVAFDGWSIKSLRDAASTLAIPQAEARWAFPHGARDLVAHYMEWSDRQLAERLEETDLDAMKIRERVAAGVRIKLTLEAERKEPVRLALAHLSAPGRQRLAFKALYRTVDLIWRAAGDRSTDYNFYTKRLLLAGVYTATVLFWLRDRSEEHAESWRFLDARIDNALVMGKTAGTVIGKLSRFGDAARLVQTLREGLAAMAAPAAGWRR